MSICVRNLDFMLYFEGQVMGFEWSLPIVRINLADTGIEPTTYLPIDVSWRSVSDGIDLLTIIHILGFYVKKSSAPVTFMTLENIFTWLRVFIHFVRLQVENDVVMFCFRTGGGGDNDSTGLSIPDDHNLFTWSRTWVNIKNQLTCASLLFA